ncbi:MAG: hypothetical protein ABL984_00165 [Pyrinomonadaceae bacterium]
MSAQDISNYTKRDTQIRWRWVSCDLRISNEQIKELMGDVEPSEIARDAFRTTVGFFSTVSYSIELLDKVRDFEREHLGLHDELWRKEKGKGKAA